MNSYEEKKSLDFLTAAVEKIVSAIVQKIYSEVKDITSELTKRVLKKAGKQLERMTKAFTKVTDDGTLQATMALAVGAKSLEEAHQLNQTLNPATVGNHVLLAAVFTKISNTVHNFGNPSASGSDSLKGLIIVPLDCDKDETLRKAQIDSGITP